MTKALLRLTLTLAVIGLWSAHAHALLANDPQFYCDQTGGEWNEGGSGCGPAGSTPCTVLGLTSFRIANRLASPLTSSLVPKWG